MYFRGQRAGEPSGVARHDRFRARPGNGRGTVRFGGCDRCHDGQISASARNGDRDQVRCRDKPGRQSAITNLKEAGYCRESAPKLSVAIEVSERNLAEIPAIWRKARLEGIEPRVQIITPKGGERKTADRSSQSDAGAV